MQLQEAQQHQQLNGQKFRGLQTRLSRCFFLTKDQDRWKSQLSTCVRTPSTSVKLRLSSVESTRFTNVIMLKRLNNGSAKIFIVRGVK